MPQGTSSQSALSLFSQSPDPSYSVSAEPREADAREFLARWRARAQDGDIVIGTDIPSRPFARFLANLMIVEPVEEEKDCRIRLAGSLVRRRYGREVSGQRMSGLFSPHIFERHIADMREVRRTGKPLILAATVPQKDTLPLSFDVVIVRALAPDRQTMWNVVGVFMRSA